MSAGIDAGSSEQGELGARILPLFPAALGRTGVRGQGNSQVQVTSALKNKTGKFITHLPERQPWGACGPSTVCRSVGRRVPGFSRSFN